MKAGSRSANVLVGHVIADACSGASELVHVDGTRSAVEFSGQNLVIEAPGDAEPAAESAIEDQKRACAFAYPTDLFTSGNPGDAPYSGEPCFKPGWWLVYTKSRQEKSLSRQLSALGVSHYLPVHQREASTRGKIRLVEEPLFAGYLFLFGDSNSRREALSTNCVSSALPVADSGRLYQELKQIHQSISNGARLTVEALIDEGDWVRVKRGLHSGLQGRVLRRNGGARLVLAVNFLKRGASFEIHDSLLEKIEEPEWNAQEGIEIISRGNARKL